ncbi:AMP-dependent synthetase/ligase [Chloropicon primus]|uniref:AMP-dependent synthetase/ligase n=1 Tax=Chloropicon primus TaxID=1764295 RepID=A0A5B8MLB8_9CHLO|nr:AMP-dependent synthetase/ligase [Chloropicon primus]|eukprot:QDZ20182.1 AMP-dependent synthetase/ligase [Chloropicon primus]
MASMRKWTGKVAPEELADDFAGGVDKSREEHGEGLESTTDLAVPDGGVADVLEDCGVWHWLSEAARVRGGKIGSVDVKVSESGEQTARLFTYQEMYQRARDAAGFMFSRGVARHSRIAIFSTNCHDIIEVHFAAAALQATVINLNVNLKPGELRFILEDSRVDAIFAHPILAPTLEDALSEVDDAAGASQLGMPKFLVWLDSRVGGIVEAEFSCEGITYESCIDSGTDRMSEIRHHWKEDFEYQWYYTSGTTGKPKGVILRHDQICLHALSTIEEMGLQTTDVWGHISPMFHLVDAFAIYAITHVGGSHVVFPRFTALGVLDMLERERVSCTNLASTMLTMLIHHPTCWGRDYTSLRIMSCGGSPQSNSNVKKTISIFGCEFFVSYGMTECCGKISMSLLPKDRRKLSLENQVQLICTSGRPFISIELKVLQEDGSEVIWDDRSLGEIVVKGPTVFDGYFRLQDSKSKHFHGEWFRTGDVAHVSSLGYITIADRIKDMILCGGENVYCVEVENVLHAHPSVKQAAVFGTKDDIMGELVNAAIVLKDEETTGNRTSEIRSYCRERMSAYKVPTKYYFLLQMPTTSSGKIMKNRLRDMFGPTMEQHSHKPVMRSSIWEVCGYRQTLSSHLVESGESCAVVIASESDCLRRVLDALDLSQLSMARIVICTDRDMSDTVLSMVDRFPHFQLYLVVVPSLDALNVTSDRSLPVDLEVLIMHVAEVNANSIFVFDQNSFESMLDGLASLNQEFSQQLTTNGEHIEEMRSSLQGRVAEIAGKLLEQNLRLRRPLVSPFHLLLCLTIQQSAT